MGAAVIRSLERDDIHALAGVLGRAYVSQQHYEPRLAAYLTLRTLATFVAVVDGQPVGMVIGNDYGPSAYVSQMAVDPSFQRRGIGTLLMNGLMAWVTARGFRATELDATPAGAPLYARYGFCATGRTDVYCSTARAVSSSALRTFCAADRQALFALDAAAFGADRSEILGELIDRAPEAVLVADARSGLAGYAVVQHSAQALGPVIARDPQIAGDLIDAGRALLPPVHRINVPAANVAIAELLAARGYRLLRSLPHMVHGEPIRAPRDRIFARINLGQG